MTPSARKLLTPLPPSDVVIPLPDQSVPPRLKPDLIFAVTAAASAKRLPAVERKISRLSVISSFELWLIESPEVRKTRSPAGWIVSGSPPARVRLVTVAFSARVTALPEMRTSSAGPGAPSGLQQAGLDQIPPMFGPIQVLVV